jgi:2-hydroxychromene-2-carboxylate isomerase
LKVEFQFDFGSPNAYLAEFAIPAIEKRTGVKFEYVPVLLGGIYKATNNMSPFESLRGIKNKPEISGAGNPALYPPPQHYEIQAEPVLSRQHADADAWRRGGPVREYVRALFPRRLSSHVG